MHMFGILSFALHDTYMQHAVQNGVLDKCTHFTLAKWLILISVVGCKEYDFNFELYYASLLISTVQLTVVTQFQRTYINRFVGVGGDRN